MQPRDRAEIVRNVHVQPGKRGIYRTTRNRSGTVSESEKERRDAGRPGRIFLLSALTRAEQRVPRNEAIKHLRLSPRGSSSTQTFLHSLRNRLTSRRDYLRPHKHSIKRSLFLRSPRSKYFVWLDTIKPRITKSRVPSLLWRGTIVYDDASSSLFPWRVKRRCHVSRWATHEK